MTVTATKKDIMIEIRDIEERHCIDCQIKKEWRENLGSYRASMNCIEKCKIGKKIGRLGDILNYGKPTRVARDLTEDVYLEEREKEKTDIEISKVYKLSLSALKKRKRHWGIKDVEEKWSKLSVADYDHWKRVGLDDASIADMYGMNHATLNKFKNRHGMTHKPRHLRYTIEGEEITPDLYHRDKPKVSNNRELAELWGIGFSTLMRRMKKWREDGSL